MEADVNKSHHRLLPTDIIKSSAESGVGVEYRHKEFWCLSRRIKGCGSADGIGIFSATLFHSSLPVPACSAGIG